MDIKQIRLPKDMHSFPIGKYQKVCEAFVKHTGADGMIEDEVLLAIDVVMAISGEPKALVASAPLVDLLDVCEHISRVIADYEPAGEPSREVEVNGSTYVLTGGADNWNGSQYLDIKTNAPDMQNDWSKIAACMYVKKGQKYGEVDDNKKPLEPMSERADIFKDHFPASAYQDGDFSNFFLKNLKKKKDSSSRKNSKIEKKR